ncbi:MAG: DUF7507 domain-containing protein, partial [Silanimonas sp.]
ICLSPATTPETCDTAIATVVVRVSIDAVDDGPVTVPGTGGTTPSVVINDTVNGQPLVLSGPGANATLTPGTAPSPAAGSITMNADGTITVAPGTTPGTYAYPYTVCISPATAPPTCDTATLTIVIATQAGLTIDKIAAAPSGNTAGSTIAYRFVVTNTGNVTLTGVVVNDPILDAPAACPVTTLAPAASTTCTGTRTLTQADVNAGVVNNTATASATTPAGPVLVSAPDTTTTPIVRSPALRTVKTGALSVDTGMPGMADEGDVIAYEVTITNSGNVTLTLTDVLDSLENRPATRLVCTPTVLAPGATATCTRYTYTVTALDVATAGPMLENVVNVTASALGSTQTVSASGVARFALAEVPAQVRVTKVATPRDVRPGDVVRYTVSMQNVGTTNVVDGTLVDTPPAGFSFVDGSLRVDDGDDTGRLAGTFPVRVDGLDIAVGGRAEVTYFLRVGAGVGAGIHTNTAFLQDNGRPVSNTASADVQMVGDPAFDESLIVGTVFHDRDGDGWQDRTALGDVQVRGGFDAGAYVPGSTEVDRGDGFRAEPDASAPLLHGLAIGAMPARQSEADPGRAIVIRQTLREPRFTSDFALSSDEGVTLRMAADGSTRIETAGDAAEGLVAAMPEATRRVTRVADGYVVEYTIRNVALAERGIPGVRIASVEGLLVETDPYGRYSLVGVEGGRVERGRNVILKVDPATLPPGSTFTTDNPLVRRVTPGLPVRFDFGVKMPATVIEGGETSTEVVLGTVLFEPGSAELREAHRPTIATIAGLARERGEGEIVIGAEGNTELLAFERAIAMREAIAAELPPEALEQLRFSVRPNPDDADSTAVSVAAWPQLGTVLFDTDRAEIKPEYLPLVRRVAAYIEGMGITRVAVTGHADRRGSEAHNIALGLRRAKAVHEAIAAALPPAMRGRLRVDINEDPAAPVGKNGQ